MNDPRATAGQRLAERLVRWADARGRRNPGGHGKTGTQLLRDAAARLRDTDEAIQAYIVEIGRAPNNRQEAAVKAATEQLVALLGGQTCAACGEVIAGEAVTASDGEPVHLEHEGDYEDVIYFREFNE